MTSYYIMQNGQLMGPADDAKIKSLLSKGLISTDAIISQDRLNWFPVKSLLEIESRPEEDFIIEPCHRHGAIPKPLMVVIWVLVLTLALLVSASGVVLVYTGTLQRWFPLEQLRNHEEEEMEEADSEEESGESKEGQQGQQEQREQ
ncbi:MAG: hypothetical protein IKS20_06235 [Victivallales bacterium]|nr:hypothetical protein [Victivallales bacterium]